MKIPLTERAYHALRHDIVTSFFKPGQGLTEEMLARRYSTSRTPIRQAAARAMQENLLHFVPNKGYFVSLVRTDHLNELYQYRTIIEGSSAELAAKKKHSPNVLDRIRRFAAVKHEHGNRKSFTRFIEADRNFHIGVAQLTRNLYLQKAVEDLRDSIDRLLYMAIEVEDYNFYLANHEEIYRAIQNRNPEQARKLMLQHILESRVKVLEMI